MGKQFCMTLHELSNPDQSRVRQAIKDIDSLFPEGGNDPAPKNEQQSLTNVKNLQAAY
jgi:hypothetical protein